MGRASGPVSHRGSLEDIAKYIRRMSLISAAIINIMKELCIMLNGNQNWVLCALIERFLSSVVQTDAQ